MHEFIQTEQGKVWFDSDDGKEWRLLGDERVAPPHATGAINRADAIHKVDAINRVPT